ncbi:hypothetical protein SAMN05878482_102880 [Peribacillus simplex]|uniref:Uncharacterized protein n=1 Tax=Peribacillus simplex TaxID=1478 RepID=A0A9X8WKA3_9BACI|nr:hypothetical protein [Peribacillus simplex]SIR05622.1 hypothetical protein SAMN05878482_102880 [Peribacillus simplex]
MTSTNTVFHMLVTSIEIIDDIYITILSRMLFIATNCPKTTLIPTYENPENPLPILFLRLIIFHEGHAL